MYLTVINNWKRRCPRGTIKPAVIGWELFPEKVPLISGLAWASCLLENLCIWTLRQCWHLVLKISLYSCRLLNISREKGGRLVPWKNDLWHAHALSPISNSLSENKTVKKSLLMTYSSLQMVGQVMWCLAHTLWIGNSVALAASVGLIGHHLFGAWNGDRRLAIRYGEAFEAVKSRTSTVPFAAIIEGRQKLPKDYYKEFLRLPYLSITALTLFAYFAHPLMQAGSFGLHW